MHVLPHCGVEVPEPCLTVTRFEQHGPGGAMTAEVSLGDQRVGTIVNRGRGAPTRLIPLPAHAQRVRAFLAACRLYGAPVDEPSLLNLLLDEYQSAVVVAEATAEHRRLARLTDRGFTRGWLNINDLPEDMAGQRFVLDSFAEAAGFAGPGAWEVWTGEAWEFLAG